MMKSNRHYEAFGSSGIANVVRARLGSDNEVVILALTFIAW